MFIIGHAGPDVKPRTSRLEANILEDGEVREPIVAWGDTIIDGHNRWKIILAHPEIPFKVKQMNFADKWDAKAWAYRNQLGRRNLNDEQRTYLIGTQYEARKKSLGVQVGNSNAEKQSAQSGPIVSGPSKTAYIIAKEHGIGKETVKRSEHFANGLDTAESVSPGVKEAVLSGRVSLPKSAVAEKGL